MTLPPFLADPDLTLYVGDVSDVLRELPDESVHCVVTSPPYWGLRDYGVDGQLGLEPTPELYVERMVAVFREVRRVLRRDGTCWLNIGDSYASAGLGGSGNRDETRAPGFSGSFKVTPSSLRDRAGALPQAPTRHGVKCKDLIGIPWRLAFALQADGWYLRAEVIWAKPNPMPESVTDRPTKSHEQVFLLTRSARYFYDADAVREPAEWARWGDQTYSPEAEAMYGQRVKTRTKEEIEARYVNPGNRTTNGPRSTERRHETAGFEQRLVSADKKRNLRSVWSIATQPYPEAHFATYPEELVRRCVLAGTSERGCCPECGAPWEREVERAPMEIRPAPKRAAWQESGDPRARTAAGGTVVRPASARMTGWRPTCDHYDFERAHKTPETIGVAPCIVLDPFGGSGTTALVARKHGRRSILVELSPKYARLAADRLSQLSLLADGAAA